MKAVFLSPLDENNQAIYADLAEYREAFGIPDDAQLLVPQIARSVADANDGDRISFTGNIAWQTTDELKLDMDVLYTKRNMNESELENHQFETNRAGSVLIRPKSAPFQIAREGTRDEDVNQDGVLFNEDQYAITDIDFANSRLDYGNREFDFQEQTRGVFLGAEWISGPLTLESNLSLSSATNDFVQVSFTNRYRNFAVPIPDQTDPAYSDLSLIGNGVWGSLSTRGTNVGAIFADINGAENLPLLDLPYYGVDEASGNPLVPGRNNTSFTTPVRINGGTANFGIGANTQSVERDLTTFDFSALYELDMPVLSSVKAGFRMTTDDTTANFLNNSLEGTATDLLSSDLQIRPYSSTGSAFFNGQLGRPIQESDGWLSLDVNSTIELLQSRGLNLSPGQLLTGGGFIARDNPAGPQAGQNFDAEQNTQAIFVMGNLDHDINDNVSLTGNIGVRYVNTEITTDGFQLDPADRTVANPFRAKNDYNNFLPSANFNFNIREDWVVRVSANKGMTRPNLKGLRPSLELTAVSRPNPTPEPTPEIPNPVAPPDRDQFNVKLGNSTIEALTAVSLDLSVEWYNRPGSNIGIALFQKDFKGQFSEQGDLCPSSFNLPIYPTLILARDDMGECRIQNADQIPFNFGTVDENGVVSEDETIDLLNLSQSSNTSEKETFVGLELFATQNFDFLPGFWSGFGVNASYTHLDNRDDADFFRISEDSVNFVGYWENEIFSTRLSWNWRSDYRLDGGGSFFGRQERIVESRSQMDLLLSYNPIEHVQLTFQAFNLTDELLLEHDYRSDRLFRRAEYPGRTYSFKASYTF